MSEKHYRKSQQIRVVDIANRVNISKSILDAIGFDKDRHVFIITKNKDNEVVLRKALITEEKEL